MSKTITGSPAFSTSLTVPVKLDSGATPGRALDVEAFAKKLIDNDVYLKEAVENIDFPDPPDLGPYARKDAANTFTETQQIDGSLNVRDGGNVDVEGGIHADGTITSDSNIETTQDVKGHNISTTGGGNVNAAGGTVSGNLLHSDSDANVGGDCNVGGDLNGDTVTSRGAIVLPGGSHIQHTGSDADKRRATMLNIYGGTISGASDYTVSDDKITAGATPIVIRLPIRLPQGAALEHVMMTHRQTGIVGTGNNFRVVRKEQSWPSNSTTYGSAPYALHGAGSMGPSGVTGTSDYYVTEDGGGAPESIDNASNEYTLVIELMAAGELYSARLEWIDPGPRND